MKGVPSRSVLATVCIGAILVGHVRAEDVDAIYNRLKGADGKVHLTKAQLADLLKPAHAPATAPKPDSLMAEFSLLDDKPSDGALTRAQVKKELITGRLSSPVGLSEDEIIRHLFPANNNFLRFDAYAEARNSGMLAFSTVDDATAAANLKKEDQKFKWKDHLSITASGLGDKKAQGPATVAWIRERKDMHTTSRWDVDAKLEFKAFDLLERFGLRQSLEPFARAEARIVDYNSREANEMEGALNHLRYAGGLEWVINGSKDSGNGHIFRVEGEYETDPSNDYRNSTALITYTPIIKALALNHINDASWLGQRWTYTFQPIVGFQLGEYDKEVADKVTAVGPPTVTKLGGGLETVTQTRQHNHLITSNDIQRALLAMNFQLTMNDRLSLSAAYKMAANLNGDNEVFHLGQVNLAYQLTPVDSDLKLSLVGSYIVGQDAPTFERNDIFRVGVGAEF